MAMLPSLEKYLSTCPLTCAYAGRVLAGKCLLPLLWRLCSKSKEEVLREVEMV